MKKIKIDNQEIKEILTVNGIRFSFEDGSWGLIRASSNKPSLVIVTESPTSNERKKKFLNLLINYFKKLEKLVNMIKKFNYFFFHLHFFIILSKSLLFISFFIEVMIELSL